MPADVISCIRVKTLMVSTGSRPKLFPEQRDGFTNRQLNRADGFRSMLERLNTDPMNPDQIPVVNTDPLA